jgi:tRNA pseudouridine38-40 synthase
VKSRRLKLIVAYDGRGFDGWQRQKDGNTIQDAIERAFRKICGASVRVIGAGRTDAGVHALGQCAHADVPGKGWKAERWVSALNGTLPRSIRILRARFVSTKFHARFSATSKTYRYRIVNSAILSPFEIGRTWHLKSALDPALLREAAQLFAGCHDFAGFAANRGKPEVNAVRVIESVRVRQNGELIELEFSGNGFLYKMVRLMIGAIVRCASGKEPIKLVRDRLERSAQRGPGFAAPADGLYLVRVRY